MKEWYYGMWLRPFSLGAQPKGVIRVEDAAPYSTKHKKYYSVIVYDRELTADEVWRYSLDLVRISKKE